MMPTHITGVTTAPTTIVVFLIFTALATLAEAQSTAEDSAPPVAAAVPAGQAADASNAEDIENPLLGNLRSKVAAANQQLGRVSVAQVKGYITDFSKTLDDISTPRGRSEAIKLAGQISAEFTRLAGECDRGVDFVAAATDSARAAADRLSSRMAEKRDEAEKRKARLLLPIERDLQRLGQAYRKAFESNDSAAIERAKDAIKAKLAVKKFTLAASKDAHDLREPIFGSLLSAIDALDAQFSRNSTKLELSRASFVESAELYQTAKEVLTLGNDIEIVKAMTDGLSEVALTGTGKETEVIGQIERMADRFASLSGTAASQPFAATDLLVSDAELAEELAKHAQTPIQPAKADQEEPIGALD